MVGTAGSLGTALIHRYSFTASILISACYACMHHRRGTIRTNCRHRLFRDRDNVIQSGFYKMIRILPSGLKKLKRVKEKWLKKQTNLSVKQVAVLRLVPFIHFHLLSYCLLEISSDFKEYTKSSLFANFPLAVVYTSVGQWITLLSLPMMIIFSGALIGLTFLIRKKYEVVLWRDFFQPAP